MKNIFQDKIFPKIKKINQRKYASMGNYCLREKILHEKNASKLFLANIPQLIK